MLKAVVFDFDGIIVDSEPLHYRAFQRVLEPLGLGYSWEAYVDHYMGFDDRDAFAEAFRAGDRSLDDQALAGLIDAKARHFQDVLADGVTPYPGVVELITSLAGRIPLALCSGALRSDIVPVLQMLGLEQAFDCMVTADEVAASKPDPTSYRLALARLQHCFPHREIVPAAALAIEDTPAGIASAIGAGMSVVAVTNSYPEARLTGALLVVPTLARIGLAELQRLV
jgi:beta-phosphoglucomutase